MHLVVIGLNHKTAPVEIREKLSINQSELRGALSCLKKSNIIHECLILSTCNRTEIYAYTTLAGNDTIINWMSEFFKLPSERFKTHLYSHSGHHAAQHLFKVAAGINSMALGEAQILGQVKIAHAAALESESSGAIINSLFQQAINVGKRARSETQIGQGAFSTGSVAVQLAKSIFEDLKGRTLLIVGAGKMAELAATHLVSSCVGKLIVTNRTHERAKNLAEQFNGEAANFDDLPSLLTKADIVITSTGAKDPIITRKMVSEAMHKRRGRPIFFIDIAVPRDIEPEVAVIDNVFVYNIDDLQSAVSTDAACRQIEVAKVESIIAQEVENYMIRSKTLDAVPVIAAMRDKLEDIRFQELEKLRGKLKHLSTEDIEAIDATTRSIINKICHQPMIQLKEYAADGSSTAKLETICEVFGICPTDNNS